MGPFVAISIDVNSLGDIKRSQSSDCFSKQEDAENAAYKYLNRQVLIIDMNSQNPQGRKTIIKVIDNFHGGKDLVPKSD